MAGLRPAKPNEFDIVFSIMKDSFPPDEYRSYEAQKALIDNSKYSIYVLPGQKDEDIRAFVTVWRFESFAYVEHFAVNSSYRNQGLGSFVINEISHFLKCRICLEVEPPESDFAKRRIEFYRRNGFCINDYPYVQPPYSKEKNPVELLLMTSESSISKECFEKIKKILYKEVYKVSHMYEDFS